MTLVLEVETQDQYINPNPTESHKTLLQEM